MFAPHRNLKQKMNSFRNLLRNCLFMFRKFVVCISIKYLFEIKLPISVDVERISNSFDG